MRTELQPLGKYHWSGKRQVRSPLNWDHYGQVTQPHRKCEWSGKRQVRSLNWDHLSQWQVAQAHSEHQLKEKTSYIHRRLQATSNITTWNASCLRNATIFTLDQWCTSLAPLTWMAGTMCFIWWATISLGKARMRVRQDARRSSRYCFTRTRTCHTMIKHTAYWLLLTLPSI